MNVYVQYGGAKLCQSVNSPLNVISTVATLVSPSASETCEIESIIATVYTVAKRRKWRRRRQYSE